MMRHSLLTVGVALFIVVATTGLGTAGVSGQAIGTVIESVSDNDDAAKKIGTALGAVGAVSGGAAGVAACSPGVVTSVACGAAGAGAGGTLGAITGA